MTAMSEPLDFNGVPAESTPSAAVAILHALSSASEEETVLLIRRAQRQGDPWSGHWSFPGGRRDAGDADLLSTALRELREECGIELGPEHLHERLADDWAGRVIGSFVMVAPFVFRVPRQLPMQVDAAEVAEAVWMPLAVVRDEALHSVRQLPGLAAERRFPAFDLRGTPVWGFTYRVLCQWAGVPVADEGLLPNHQRTPGK
jgi:8-oxo-dGTP pyrophosphatase MutT (NUDIX family)